MTPSSASPPAESRLRTGLAHPSRSDAVASRLAELAETASPGQRLGSKEDLRTIVGVSMGTFNEALRLLRARGLITVRPGPGGGLFAAEQSPIVRLGNSLLEIDSDQAPITEAARIRDALDPLLVEDALEHASPADVDMMRHHVARMSAAVDAADPTAFVRANWALHAHIASVSPHPILRSVYSNMLDLIETHTLSVLPLSEQPMPDNIAKRHLLHRDLVEAIAARNREWANQLIAEHRTISPCETQTQM